MKYKHTTPIQVRFNDIDIVGHVNNAIHQQYFDFARLRYFEEVFNENVDWDRAEVLILASITVDYINPIFLEDNLFVNTQIFRIGNKSLGMAQQIFTKKGDEIIINSENTSVLVSFDQKKKESIELPENWKESIAKYEINDFNLPNKGQLGLLEN